MTWPPEELRAAARRVVLQCPDCAGEVRVHWSKRRGGRWVADLGHRETCPTRRTSRSRRAAERDLTDELAAALHLADYAIGGDLIMARHRLAAAP